MSNTRADIRTRVRDYLYESTADIWSDATLNRLYLEELRSLPDKDIYLEELWTMSSVIDQQDYTLPTGTVKVERLERNNGTSALPDWTPVAGWDNYAGALYLPFRALKVDTYRAFLKKNFTEVTDEGTALDVPDNKTEVLVWGIVCRAYRVLIGYLQGSKSWDSVTKPGGVDITSVQGWLRDADKRYKELIQQYLTSARPREIDLVS